MSEKITEKITENTENQNNTEIIRVNAFFVTHEDGLDEIVKNLILLNDYTRVWKIIKKRNMYYVLFNNNREYLKMWTDRQKNLLFYFGSLSYNLFFDNIEIGMDSTGCVIYTNNAIQCNEKVIEFKNLSVIDVIRQIDYNLINPVIWLLCTKLY